MKLPSASGGVLGILDGIILRTFIGAWTGFTG